MRKVTVIRILEALFFIMATLMYALYIYEAMKQSTVEDDIWGANMDIIFAIILAVPLYLAIGDICFSLRYWILEDNKSKIKSVLNLMTGIVSITMLLSLLGALEIVEFQNIGAVQFFDSVLILMGIEIVTRIVYFKIKPK